MTEKNTSTARLRIDQRNQQGEALQEKEAELHNLASQGKKEDFFNLIAPRLGPLKDYVRRRLRVAYLEQQVATPVYTTGDILDWVILRAYENFQRRPKDVSLEEWLYRLTNEILDEYLHKRSKTDKRRFSLEDLRKKELRTLEEVEKMTADVEGEPYLVEDLDDSEYQESMRTPPADEDNPERELEREEELEGILQALSQIPTRDRVVFELFAMEGFSKGAVSRITGIPADEVPRIVERVRAQILQNIAAEQPAKHIRNERAS